MRSSLILLLVVSSVSSNARADDLPPTPSTSPTDAPAPTPAPAPAPLPVGDRGFCERGAMGTSACVKCVGEACTNCVYADGGSDPLMCSTTSAAATPTKGSCRAITESTSAGTSTRHACVLQDSVDTGQACTSFNGTTYCPNCGPKCHSYDLPTAWVPRAAPPPPTYFQTCTKDGNETTCTDSTTKPVKARRGRPQRIYIGLEIGTSRAGDATNLYGDGPGRSLVLGSHNVELRLLESYDLEDRSKMFDNVAFTAGQLRITSLAYRLGVFRSGPLEVTLLGGLAWIRRPYLGRDPPDPYFQLNEEVTLRAQNGGAGLVGAGVVLFGLVTIDVRAYPTSWSSIEGLERFQVHDGTMALEAVTESPGGMPTTVNVGVGVGF